MKTKLFIMIFMICGLVSCKSKKNNNVVLTNFTKELISMYIQDVDNIESANRKDEIIIISVADSLYYYFSIFANNSKSYNYCNDDIVGQTLYLGHLIRVFGNDCSIFYYVKNKVKTHKKCNDNDMEYDPNEWFICFHKNKSFCKMKTYKVTADKDISAIQNLAEQYFSILDTMHINNENEVYQLTDEIENSPKFALGEDSLRHIISENFKIHKDKIFDKIPIVVSIVVDKKGNATVNGIIKSSKDTALDNEALRVAEIVCQYQFIPACHRGQKVNAVYSVVFFSSDIKTY